MTAFGFKTDSDLQALTPEEIHAEAERTIRMIRSTSSDTSAQPFERYLHKIVRICTGTPISYVTREQFKRVSNAYICAESDAIQTILMRQYNDAQGGMTEEQIAIAETIIRQRQWAKREQRGLLKDDLMLPSFGDYIPEKDRHQ